MTENPTNYRKLPGRGLTLNGRGGLWVAEDHLLEVTSTVIMERYRRFFFHDTLAFIVRPTRMRVGWAWAQASFGTVALLAALFLGWFGAANAGEDWHVVIYVMSGLAAAVAILLFTLLVFNLVLGPSCSCHVLTITGWHRLAAPARMAQALRVQAEVVPLIDAAQNAAPAQETGAGA